MESPLSLLAAALLLLLLALTPAAARAASRSSASAPVLVDVTQHGAVGDGRTDNTHAVQAAVDVLMQSREGGTLFFPAVRYVCLQLSTRSRAQCHRCAA